MRLLIQNGRVVDPVNGTVSILDLYAENGRCSSWSAAFRRRPTW